LHQIRQTAVALAIVLLAATPALAVSGKSVKTPAGTTRDANGHLHDNATGKFTEDECAVGQDGTDAMRRRLRQALKCTDDQQAHHIIPLELRELPPIQLAIKVLN
jgi:invasion protein IalB